MLVGPVGLKEALYKGSEDNDKLFKDRGGWGGGGRRTCGIR